MTGLDVENNHILEIACLITDENLISVDDYLNLIIYQPNEILENMTDWCKVQHKKSGLITACQSSKITLKEAEEIMLKYLKKHISYKVCPLAGNSIHTDYMFLRKYMPLVNDYLHYRIIDVSTIRELTRRWHPNMYKAAPKKEYNHRAVDDIKDSIDELRYYRQHMFIA
ncbi:Oligoribonuclease, mitochondrial [Harpegnathos saltator]|uniref:Probable oligoribonuclease n=1 Tax=Harpegnathos saltator TaxID=610380 RepID=E2BLK7_HARSA|nr:Oligoribonuclease, mitochondrial [Harpegnathos saltator]